MTVCAWYGGMVPTVRAGKPGARVFCKRTHKDRYYAAALKTGLEALDRAETRPGAAERTSERHSNSCAILASPQG